MLVSTFLTALIWWYLEHGEVHLEEFDDHRQHSSHLVAVLCMKLTGSQLHWLYDVYPMSPHSQQRLIFTCLRDPPAVRIILSNKPCGIKLHLQIGSLQFGYTTYDLHR